MYNMGEPWYKENNIVDQFSRHYIVRYLDFFIYDIPYSFA